MDETSIQMAITNEMDVYSLLQTQEEKEKYVTELIIAKCYYEALLNKINNDFFE